MIRAVLIDDEPNNIGALQGMLEQYCPQVTITGMATDSQGGYAAITRLRPDLVFLDIEMPFGNGFDLLRRLEPVSFEVIFVTAFDKYALTAFRYAALDYLLKPVGIEELVAAVERARARMAEKAVNTRMETLLHNFRTNSRRLSRIALPSAEGLDFIDIDSIVFLQAEGNCTLVATEDKKRKLVSRTLKDFEELLPGDTFCRVHHSYLVNLNFISKYHKGRGGYIELVNGITIEVSSRKKDEFLLRFRS
jgi:two-component system LytT family response regulator